MYCGSLPLIKLLIFFIFAWGLQAVCSLVGQHVLLFCWHSRTACYQNIEQHVAADESSTGYHSRSTILKGCNCNATVVFIIYRGVVIFWCLFDPEWMYLNFNLKYLGNVSLPFTYCISSTQLFRVARPFKVIFVWKQYGEVNSLLQGVTQTTIHSLAINSELLEYIWIYLYDFKI